MTLESNIKFTIKSKNQPKLNKFKSNYGQIARMFLNLTVKNKKSMNNKATLANVNLIS